MIEYAHVISVGFRHGYHQPDLFKLTSGDGDKIYADIVAALNAPTTTRTVSFSTENGAATLVVSEIQWVTLEKP